MSFKTEKETEFWLSSMWAKMPMPEKEPQLVENTREFWARYWCLREHWGYSDNELVTHALQMSKEKNLPYEMCFAINAFRLPETTAE